MSNICVIYKTKYGTTKQYAEWIAEELEAPLFEITNIKPSQLMEYNAVVFGGGLYAGGILGVSFVAQNPCKSLVVFTVGLADPNNTDYKQLINKNFKQELLPQIKFFHLRGGIDYGKINFVDKTLMYMLKKKLSKKDEADLSVEDKGIINTYGKKVDFTNRSTIVPLINYVRGL
jgi:menaquinone-dependent protoporphyrinogen IX oxidase